MKQILHIFRKDSRHLWPEVLASLAILAAFVVILPSRWRPIDSARINLIMNLTSLLTILIPASWWLLVTRLVHAESLVGDNQFWITRPYHWKKLVAAKLLFLAVWLYLPFFLAQMLVLAEAGFHPLSYTPGLLFNLFVQSGFFILPLVALATVTENFARMTLTLLGVLVAFMAYSFLTSLHTGYEAAVPFAHLIVYPWMLLLCSAAAIALQYAARRVWIARIVLLAAFAIVLAVPLIISPFNQARVTQAYPPSGAKPIQLAFALDPHRPVKTNPSERAGMIYLEIPVQSSGVPDGQLMQPDDVKFSISAPDGFQWISPWWRAWPSKHLPGTNHTTVQIMMPRDLYDRLQSVPITLHLTLAVTEFKTDRVDRVAIASPDFEVPGFGICNTHPIYGRGLGCRVPLLLPPVTYIQTTWSNSPCSGPQPDAGSAVRGDTWAGEVYRDPVYSAIQATPIQFPGANLSAHTLDGHQPEDWRSVMLCPGTPITVTQYQPFARTQADLTIPDFHLPAQ